MSTISLPGLASGLDSAALIDALVAQAALPQMLLKNKVTDTQSTITALQTLNTAIAAITDKAKTAKTESNVRAFTAASTSDSVSVTAGGKASATSLDVKVTQLAKAHTVLSAQMDEWPTGVPATITFVDKDGVKTTVTALSPDVDDVLAAVNNYAGGIKATKIASGADGSGNPLYRIQFTAADTGDDSAFDVYAGDSAAVEANTATRLLDQPGAALLAQGQDAKLTLWPGTGAEEEVRSATNSFDNIISGVSITAKSISEEPATISVTANASATAGNVKTLVDSLSAAFALIGTKSRTSTTTNATGGTVVTGGPFVGEASVRIARQTLYSAVQSPVEGKSPSSIGISFDKDGVLSFDQDKFTKAYTADPSGVMKMVTGIATRVEAASAQISDKYDGLLTKKISGQETVVKSLNEQIERWDLRLDARRANLESVYAALEVSMSRLNSQSSYLTSQIASLPKPPSTSRN